MKKIKLLIVDDVKLIRVELKAMLANYPDIDIIGEANNGLKAKEMITELKPDALFLDICLPKLTGFELLDGMDSDIEAVFISSYDKYMPEAQKYNATEFLMKPIKTEQLDKAVRKLIFNIRKKK